MQFKSDSQSTNQSQVSTVIPANNTTQVNITSNRFRMKQVKFSLQIEEGDPQWKNDRRKNGDDFQVFLMPERQKQVSPVASGAVLTA